MPHALAQAVEIFTTAMTVAGMGYFAVAIVAARVFQHQRRARLEAFAPAVSILKSLKGVDPGMMDAFRSHCRQSYLGEYELLFGISGLDEPAAVAVNELRREFPNLAIRLIACPERLGANGKVSTLAQLLPHARHEFVLINDSDITVSPRYLERVMALFAPGVDPSGAKAPADSGALNVRAKARTLQSKPVGLVTALYRGRAHGTLASRFEALGISTDFQAGVLVSKLIEGGLNYGLGSTLAVSRAALNKIGGLEPLKD